MHDFNFESGDFAPYTFLPHELASQLVELADRDYRAVGEIGFGDSKDSELIRDAKTYLQKTAAEE